MAVKDAHVRTDLDHDVVAGAIWVQANAGGARGRRVDVRAAWSRKVDARVYVAAWTEWIERLELQRRAPEGLADLRSDHNPFDGQPKMAGNLARDDQPDHEATGGDTDDPHQCHRGLRPWPRHARCA